MIKQIFWGLSACLVLLSCDNDSHDNNITSDVVITGYRVDRQSAFPDANGPGTYRQITLGNVVDNKLFSESKEVIYNGISQGVHTKQHYFYSNGLLTVSDVNFDKQELFYDSNQNLIGLKWTRLSSNNNVSNDFQLYYRFSYHPNNIVFVERVTLPYNDPAAVVERRSIVQFDSDNNIIKGGRDNNLDGVMEYENQFFYTNGNLTSIQKNDGSTVNFDYSNVIDNYMVLNYNSYGKKVYKLMSSEGYSMFFNSDSGHSKNLTSQELSDGTYEVLGNNFYKKKTVTESFPDNNAHSTTTTEFFFQ
ncbi:hypothetical protein [Flavobacterium sp.]|uniref:hypothetical protein n=1 Tax=Flavobacterium sp. TaxID=239 RepID=UPI003D6AE30F